MSNIHLRRLGLLLRSVGNKGIMWAITTITTGVEKLTTTSAGLAVCFTCFWVVLNTLFLALFFYPRVTSVVVSLLCVALATMWWFLPRSTWCSPLYSDRRITQGGVVSTRVRPAPFPWEVRDRDPKELRDLSHLIKCSDMNGRVLARRCGVEIRAMMGYPTRTSANVKVATQRCASWLREHCPSLRTNYYEMVLARAILVALTPSAHEVELPST